MFRLILLTLSIASATLAQRTAVVHLQSANVTGDLLLTEVNEGISITGTLTGLRNGSYGFHIHELGDISTCDATGAHFNPEDVNHGGPDHAVRHVGDLGNVEFTNYVANVNIVDSMITLHGRNSVLGRAFVVHEAEDDLGLGGHELSLTTGNAGARVACGVIGLKSPADWEYSSAFTSMPSMFLLLSSVFFMVYRLKV